MFDKAEYTVEILESPVALGLAYTYLSIRPQDSDGEATTSWFKSLFAKESVGSNYELLPVGRLDRWWTSGQGGTIVRKRYARAHVQMHPTSDLCKALFQWVPSHTSNLNAIHPAVREIFIYLLHFIGFIHISEAITEPLSNTSNIHGWNFGSTIGVPNFHGGLHLRGLHFKGPPAPAPSGVSRRFQDFSAEALWGNSFSILSLHRKQSYVYVYVYVYSPEHQQASCPIIGAVTT